MKDLGRALGTATELGLTMGLLAAGLVVGGLFLGRWADAQLGTHPWATLLLTISAALLSQILLLRLAWRSSRLLTQAQPGEDARRSLRTALGPALLALAALVLPGIGGLLLGVWGHRSLGLASGWTLLSATIGMAGGLALTLIYLRRQRGDKA